MTARIPPPPDVPQRAEFTYEDDVEEATPVVDRRCVSCGCSFQPLPNDADAPLTYPEAWRWPIVCRGTEDGETWYWCRLVGTLYFPGRREVKFYPDRRKEKRPVAVERRGKP